MTWLPRFLVSRLPGVGFDVRPTRRQKRTALLIAGAADLMQLALAPLFAAGALSPLDGAVDVLAAAALLLTLGWRWRTALALVLELIPGLALFPSWTAVVATMPAVDEPAFAPVLAAG
jgi:hypothetical protein